MFLIEGENGAEEERHIFRTAESLILIDFKDSFRLFSLSFQNLARTRDAEF